MFRDRVNFDEEIVEMKLNSEIWEKTNQFFKNKKYEKVVKSISGENYISISTSDYFYMSRKGQSYCSLFYDKNQSFCKNNLIDAEFQHFIHNYFQYHIKIKNQENLRLYIYSIENLIEIHYENYFFFEFHYQIAKTKKELIDMLLNFKMQIEYEINNI